MIFLVFSTVVDAIGKPGSGLFEGNYFWPGSFSECEKMKKFKYCLAGFNLKMYSFSRQVLNVSIILFILLTKISKFCLFFGGLWTIPFLFTKEHSQLLKGHFPIVMCT